MAWANRSPGADSGGTGMTYSSVATIPAPGGRPYQTALRGVTVDGSGAVYLVGDKRVDVYDARSGALTRSWATPAEGLCVAVDDEGRVHVGGAGRIDVFDADGQSVRAWRDADRLGRVSDIAFYGDDVLAADTVSRSIRRFDAAGRWRNDIGTAGRLRGFFIPNGHLDFAVDQAGVVHACNPAKHRVERYALDGELLGHWGRWGNRSDADFSGCCNPTNLALWGSSHVVVSEKAPPRVKLYDRSGALAGVIPASRFDPTCKNMDLAVDRAGRVLVVDTARKRAVVFEVSVPEANGTPVGPAPSGGAKP